MYHNDQQSARRRRPETINSTPPDVPPGPPVAIVALLVATYALVGGCGSEETLGRVYGKVTCDGVPVARGIVVFSNHEKGVHMTAVIAEDGAYELQTAGGFGLPLGNYLVAVNPPIPEPPVPGAPPPAAKPPPPVDIPAKYQQLETSDLRIAVEPGENPFDIEMSST